MKKLKAILVVITSITTSLSICSVSAYAVEVEKKASITSEWRVAADEKLVDEYEKSLEYTKGKATGKYAVELSDGSYYFYHQSSSGCANSMSEDGTWNFGNTQWGTNFETFTQTACPQYSLAMIVSNLIGSEETIIDILSVQGCDFYEYEDGTIYCDVDPSPVISKGNCGLTYTLGAAEVLSNYYGLEHTDNLFYYGKEGAREQVNKVLDNGGMILLRYGNPTGSGSDYGDEQWPSRGTTGHFICIRNYDESGYYLLDPCYRLCHDYDGGVKKFADKAVAWDLIWEYSMQYEGCIGDGTIIGLWNPNDKVSQSYNKNNKHWLSDGTAIIKRENTATNNKSILDKYEICEKKRDTLEKEQKELNVMLENKNKQALENTMDTIAERLFRSSKIDIKEVG